MDTTIDLSDSSLNISSIVVVDSSPELKDPDKNRMKKKKTNRVPGKKLDDTIDLISSDDDEEEEDEDSDSNNSNSYNNHQAVSSGDKSSICFSRLS